MDPRTRACVVTVALAAAIGCGPDREAAAPSPPAPIAARAVADGDLRSPEDFQAIADPNARAAALFLEAARVMMHPRCVNCHPDGASPHQGENASLHDPIVTRGDDDRGVVGMRCAGCHPQANATLARVPGAPEWHLAPLAMAWERRTPAAICAQIKDPARNGHRTLDQIVEHSAHDPLVGWGWHPGAARAPAPGTQEKFGALVDAWAKAGAACPKEEGSR